MAGGLVATDALADPARHRDAFQAGRSAEAALDLEAADRGYAGALAEEPSGQHAAAALRRRAWIAARRDADGGFGTWRRMEQARRGGGDRATAEMVAADPAAAAAVREEADLWLIRDDLERGDVPAALARADAAWARGATGDRRRALADVRLRALVAAGRVDDARAFEAALLPGAEASPTSHSRRADTQRRRDRARPLAAAAVGLFLVVAAPGWWRHRVWPVGLLPLAVLLAGAGLLVAAWEPALAPVGPALLVALCPLHVLAGAARGAPRRALAALATLGAAWLVFEATDALPWIGL